MKKTAWGSLILAAVFLVPGCTAIPPHPADRNGSSLFQLSDNDWVDLTDVREIQFYTKSQPEVDQGAQPYTIALWHKASADFEFVFSFPDERSAYDAWKRLTDHLGGSLQHEHLKAFVPASAPVATEAPASQQLFNNTNPSFMVEDANRLKKSIDDLTACRALKLISQEEYQRGHDGEQANFVNSMNSNNHYFSGLHDLKTSLLALEELKKQHLVSDESIPAMRDAIIKRNGLSAN